MTCGSNKPQINDAFKVLSIPWKECVVQTQNNSSKLYVKVAFINAVQVGNKWLTDVIAILQRLMYFRWL